MVERISPLGAAFRPGRHGNLTAGPGVQLAEVTPPAIVEAAAWPGQKEALARAVAGATGLALSALPNAGAVGEQATAFSIGPHRFLVTGGDDLTARLTEAVPLETGTLTDLSHGRIALRVAGPRAEWVLSKLFAIDFAAAAFPVAEGRATAHHDVLAQIQRTGPDRFDLFVFRSLARAFWESLCAASEEAGYEVVR
ncbi:sarcosine oxidase subunit gamma family protein [Chelativorans intermedius]|uniref:Sarcosine oxidase subunit gamma family protein n=1 Tax=Chelativorans intermedius TaxID=515947 RepID=A0ABV6D3T0_9HYPH|nr:sarcosine oxidase subunit gamma family protein [Chelativorans intermedius]MCT8997004.1 sarcosine oxidase subunit gamma [Chelativorans intermedius]